MPWLVALEVPELSTYTTNTNPNKLYAIVLEDVVVGPFIGTIEELAKVQAEYPKHEFYEMTPEMGAVTMGHFWNKNNSKKEKINAQICNS